MYKLLMLITSACALGTNKKALKVRVPRSARDAPIFARFESVRTSRAKKRLATPSRPSRRPSPSPTPRTP